MDERALNIEKREKGWGEWKKEQESRGQVEKHVIEGVGKEQIQLQRASFLGQRLPTIQLFVSVGFDSMVVC